MMARQSVGIRLDVLGKPEVVAALRDVGREGERLADRIEKVGPPASRGLLAVDAAAGAARGKMDELAASAGATGDVLSKFGAAGKAAAIAVGALALGFGAAVARAREATREFASLGDQADRLGVSAEGLQRIQAATEQFGVDAEQTADLLGELADRAAQAQEGGNEAARAFEALGVVVTDSEGRLRPLESIIADVADGFAKMESPVERVSAASALFSDEGRKLIPLLSQGAEGLKELGDEADRAGRIVDEDLVRSSQDLNREFDKQWKIIDKQLKVSFVQLSPVIQGLMTEAVIPMIDGWRKLYEAMSDVEKKSTDMLQLSYEAAFQRELELADRINEIQAKLADPDRRTFLPGLSSRDSEDKVLRAELDRLLKERAEAERKSVRIFEEIQRRRNRRDNGYVPPASREENEDDEDEDGGRPPRLPRVDLRDPLPPLPVPRGMTAEQYEKILKARKDEQDAIDKANASLTDLAERGVADAAAGLADWAAGLRDGKDVFASLLRDLATDLPTLIFGGEGAKASTGVGGILQSVLGGAGKSLLGPVVDDFVSDLFSSSAASAFNPAEIVAPSAFGGFGLDLPLLGFASGGGFDVSAGNTARLTPRGGDDRLVAFRAQLGERVTVAPRGAAAGAGLSPRFEVNITVMGDATDETVERFRAIAREELVAAEPRLTERAVAATGRELEINPDYGR